jgi:superkiller protein 3
MLNRSNAASAVVLSALAAVMLAPLNAQVSAQALSVDQMVQRGWIAREAERYSEAEALLRGAIAQQPRNVNALLGLGLVLQDKGEWTQAIALYRQALQVSPNHASTQAALKNALDYRQRSQQFQAQKLKSLKTQLQAFDQALSLQDQAISALTKLIQAAPNRPSTYTAYVELGNTLLKRNRTDQERLFIVREIQQADPNSAIQVNPLLNDETRLSQAIAAYQKAIALNPNLPEAHYGLGNALAAQNRLRDAIAAYQRALQLNPKDAIAASQLARAKQHLSQQGRL